MKFGVVSLILVLIAVAGCGRGQLSKSQPVTPVANRVETEVKSPPPIVTPVPTKQVLANIQFDKAVKLAAEGASKCNEVIDSLKKYNAAKALLAEVTKKLSQEKDKKAKQNLENAKLIATDALKVRKQEAQKLTTMMAVAVGAKLEQDFAISTSKLDFIEIAPSKVKDGNLMLSPGTLTINIRAGSFCIALLKSKDRNLALESILKNLFANLEK